MRRSRKGVSKKLTWLRRIRALPSPLFGIVSFWCGCRGDLPFVLLLREVLAPPYQLLEPVLTYGGLHCRSLSNLDRET